MRAAVIYEHGDLDRIRLETDYPEPEVRPGWVRVAVRATSLNYHDIFSRRGMPGIRLPLPLVTGSDIAGEIVEIGPEVEGVGVGDRVLIDPFLSGQGMIGEAFDGGRAEYCLAHESQLVPIPEEVSFEAAACIPLAYATAHRMLVTRGGLAESDTVLILGASGGVGTACVLLAVQTGATVIACASTDEKLERLAELGVRHGINYVRQDMREAVWALVGRPRISGEGGVDLVVNASGGGTWQDSIRCLGRGGRLLTCGATAGFEESVDVRYVWTFEHSLIGSNGWRRSDIVSMLDLAAAGTVVPIIDRVLPLDEVHEAERLMESRALFGKIVLVP